MPSNEHEISFWSPKLPVNFNLNNIIFLITGKYIKETFDSDSDSVLALKYYNDIHGKPT